MQTSRPTQFSEVLLIERVSLQSLRLTKSTTATDGLSGKILNLLSNDVGKFDIALAFIHDLWKGPMEALLLGYFIYIEIGYSGLLGMGFLLSFIPLQGRS